MNKKSNVSHFELNARLISQCLDDSATTFHRCNELARAKVLTTAMERIAIGKNGEFLAECRGLRKMGYR